MECTRKNRCKKQLVQRKDTAMQNLTLNKKQYSVNII
jgi:hypothetical protein